MRGYPKVAIITVQADIHTDDIIECLDSLNEVDYDNFYVILINNGIMDLDLRQQISTNKKYNFEIKFFKTKFNLGFSGGNNVGIQQALSDKADFILLLNNDTVVDKRFLINLIKFAKTRKVPEILGPVVLNYDSEIIQSAGIFYNVNRATGRINLQTQKYDLKAFKKENQEVDYIDGSAILIPSKIFNEIGLLNIEYYPGFYDETDFCMRAKKRGFRLFCVYNSKIWHKRGQTYKRSTLNSSIILVRNRFLFVFNNTNYLQFIRFIIYYLTKYNPITTNLNILIGKLKNVIQGVINIVSIKVFKKILNFRNLERKRERNGIKGGINIENIIQNPSIRRVIKNLISKIPFVGKIFSEWDFLKKHQWYPPGHFYSPIHSIDDIKSREKDIIFGIDKIELKEEQKYKKLSDKIPGINLNQERQLELLNRFKNYYKDLPFEAHKKENLRYFFENSSFSYTDAIILYCMIRYSKPKKIIEVGSGYSSCVTLDTNEIFFKNAISCTFIEPYPRRFLSLIKNSDKDKINLISQNLQEVDLNLFSELSEGDILFIDSTHVAKINSDVNYLFSKILPNLKKGVFIHFHDIFFPFEYPKSWIFIGRAWNEIYLLRSFLQYNHAFEIQFFNSFMTFFYTEQFIKHLPLCMNNIGGSLWLKKI